MGSVVQGHLDELAGAANSLESGLYYGLRAAHKGHHRPVGGFTGVHVEHLHALVNAFSSLFDCFYYTVDDCPIAPFAEIRNAFYDFLHNVN